MERVGLVGGLGNGSRAGEPPGEDGGGQREGHQDEGEAFEAPMVHGEASC